MYKSASADDAVAHRRRLAGGTPAIAASGTASSSSPTTHAGVVVDLEVDFSLVLGSAKAETGLARSTINADTMNYINYYFDNGILGGIFHINEVMDLSRIQGTDFRLRVAFDGKTSPTPASAFASDTGFSQLLVNALADAMDIP